MVKTLGDRYERVSGSEAVRLINKCLKECYGTPLTQDQERALRESFGSRGIIGDLGMPFQVLKWDKEPDSKSNVLWRLSIPFLFIWFLIFKFIVCPLNWIFTGKYSFSHKSKLATFNTDWYYKIYSR